MRNRAISAAKKLRESQSDGRATLHVAVGEAQQRGLSKRDIFGSVVAALGWAVSNGQLVAGEPFKESASVLQDRRA